MARGKARFGGASQARVRYDSGSVRHALFAAIPACQRYPRSLLDRLPARQSALLEREVADGYWYVVRDIEAALWQTAWALAEHRRESSVADRRAEADKLIRLIDRGQGQRVREKLPALSRDVAQSLRAAGVNPLDPVLSPTTLRKALVQLSAADLPARRKPADIQRRVSEMLAYQFYATLSPHAAALGFDWTDLPRLLHALAATVGLCLSPVTWRKRLRAASRMGSMQVLPPP